MEVKVIWLPDITGSPGSHFFVKFRVKGNSKWSFIDPIFTDDFVIVNSLLSNETYEFQVVSIDGIETTPSVIKEVKVKEELGMNSAF